jgi:hypothetical protein
MKFLPLVTVALHLTFVCACGCAADYPPGDHAGADLTLADGDTIWGEHTNIGTLTIPTSTTVYVAPLYELVGPKGEITLRAEHVVLDGTLTASEAGYLGGRGAYIDYWGEISPNRPGDGPFGAHGEQFYGGIHCPDVWNGGYRACGANGDTSTDDVVERGSGASGLELYTCSCSNPAPAGGNGGGCIRLIASHSFAAGSGARLFAHGGAPQWVEYGSSYYNSGAGGGVLIDTRQATTVTLEHGFQIESLGGVDPLNGGTVKFFIPQDVEIDDTALSAGRVLREDGKTSLTLLVMDVQSRGLKRLRVRVKAAGYYGNLASSELTKLGYELWLVDNTSGSNAGGVLLKSGKIPRIEPGATFNKLFGHRFKFQVTGKYLLWRFPGTAKYALAGPLP